ncbi:MAG: RDD family protein [Sulfurimonadaceae bacterium]
MNNAGFWNRAVAIFIDAIILTIIMFVIMFTIGFFIGGMLSDPETVAKISNVGMLINVVIVWLYFAIQESGEDQATVGKRIMGIYVIDKTGNRISFAQATIPYFSKYLSSILMIGFIMAAFTKNKQGLHDLIADTLVVNR